jgi:hypothetical protein
MCWTQYLWTQALVAVLVWGLFATCLDVRATFGSEESDPYRGFIDGTVTAVRDKSIYIDERVFAVKSGVEVKDQSGQPVEYHKIEAGDRVRYLVQDGMVVKIVVIHPS